MTYTAVTCTKVGERHLRACLKQPFITQHAYIAQRGWNAAQVKYTGANPISYTIAGYVNYLNDGADESLWTDLGTPDQAQWGGYYTGSKLMAVALNAGDYSVGVIPHVVGDATDTSSAAMTITNVGNAGTSPPGAYTTTNGPFERHLAGPSVNGGDEISWFEGRSTTMHWLTSDGSSLTREQAFPLDGSETFRDFTDRVSSWIFDGTDVWLLSNQISASPDILILTRFVPTPVGDPYDYEKFQLTLSETATNDLMASGGGAFILGVTATSFFVQLTDYSSFGNIKWLEVSKDGTEYTEYFVTGSAAVESLVTSNLYYPQKLAGGTIRLVGTAYPGDGPAVGTYDLTCTGNQGHVHAKKRTLGPPIITTGNLIPSGDMNAGSDVFKASGDMGPGNMLWKETK